MARDLRELEIVRFESYMFPIPVVEFEGTEYWSTGKHYEFRDADHLARFLVCLSVENKREGSDVAVGPYYEFDDDRGFPLPIPIRTDDPLLTSPYYAIGERDLDIATKKRNYDVHSNRWDGVAQSAAYAARK